MKNCQWIVFLLAFLFIVLPAIDVLTKCTRAHTGAVLDEIDKLAVPTVSAGRSEPASTPVDGGWALVKFFAPVLLVAAALGVSGSVLGTFVLLREEALLALSLPQAVAVGVAVALRLGWPVLPLALVFVLLLLMLVAYERGRQDRRPGASLIAAIYIGSLCVAFLIVANSGQHAEELHHLFTGVDVAVTVARAAWVTPCLLLCATVTAVYWRRWLLLAQAPAAAELAGVSVGRNHAAFVGLLGTYVLLGTSTQGIVLVLVMLFVPATAVAPWGKRLPAAMLAAVAVSVVMLIIAFTASNYFSWPLSHSLGGIGLAIVVLLRMSGVVRRA